MTYIKTNWSDNVTNLDDDALNKIENGIGNLDAGVTANAVQIASLASGSPKGTFATLAILQADTNANTVDGKKYTYIVTADGNWYYWNGTWTAGGVYQSTGLSFIPVIGIPSKNLFNKETAVDNTYLYTDSGGVGTGTGYTTSDYIPVLSNNQYTLKEHLFRVCFYDSSNTFISGNVLEGPKTFTTPTGTAFIRFTTSPEASLLNQLELGGVSTDYEPFGNVISPDYITAVMKKQLENIDAIGAVTKPRNVVTVAKSGGNYNTIMAAVNAYINDIDNPLTIDLCPGIYLESVDLREKHISVVGRNKRTCIVRCDSGDYWQPPFNLSAQNHLFNLTAIMTSDFPTDGSPGIWPYAIHMDGSILDGLTSINNCITDCDTNVSIGMGLSNNQTILIDGCEVHSVVNGIACHNQQSNGAINQRLIIKNSWVESDNENAVFVQDANHREGGGYGDARDTIYSFYNNMFWSKINGKTDVVGGDASLEAGKRWGYIKVSDDSFGNNVTELNK